MKFFGRATLVSLLLAAVLPEAAGVTPLSKVMQMLEGMVVKGKAEKVNEETEFAKFKVWCESVKSDATKNIEEATRRIEQLEADIDKAESDAEVLAEEIAELEASLMSSQAEAKNASAIRAKERADYADTHADLTESIDAIRRALGVLKQRMPDVPQSLAQVMKSSRVPDATKATIESFLMLGSGSTDEEGAPEANAYEFQSNSVVNMLEELSTKFSDQKLALEKAEMDARHNFEILMQKLVDDMKTMKQNIESKTANKASRMEEAAAAKGDLEATKNGKDEDEKRLRDTLSECHSSSQEFEKNQVLRAQEIKAIETAVSILGGSSVKGTADKYLPTALAQSSFAQVRRNAGDVRETRQRVVEFLQDRASSLNSKSLSVIAARALSDPFGKVKKMIKDMIVKLMEQANEETDQKAYCDAELATNQQTRENKADEVEELTAEVEKHTAQSAQFATEIKELSEAVAELIKQQTEATKIRNEEKATNAQTVADAKDAQMAVENARKVLKDYYAMASDASLLQNGVGLGQEMQMASSAPYKGMQVAGGNVLDFLDVVLSDFARLESDTASAEDMAAENYESFMNESNEDIAVKRTELSHKEEVKQECDEANENFKKELQLTQEELDAANTYYEKLKPECVDTGLSYEERVSARKEEINSLMEAMKILNQQDVA